MVEDDYQHIWDCCCDHGLLGATLLKRNSAPNIHFVDIVPPLMAQLEAKLQQFFADSAHQWQTHCMDVSQLPLEQFQGKQLVIIAGVGGDLMVELVTAIHQRHPTLDIDFLLCPVHHQYTLRHQLASLNFSLKNEILVEENNRYYEVILASNQIVNGKAISIVGEAIWQTRCPKQHQVCHNYLTTTLTHYQRVGSSNTANVATIIEHYQSVNITPLSVAI